MRYQPRCSTVPEVALLAMILARIVVVLGAAMTAIAFAGLAGIPL